jgi:hypothetical protein
MKEEIGGWGDKEAQAAHEAWAERLTNKEAFELLGNWSRVCQMSDARHDARGMEARSMTEHLVVCGNTGAVEALCYCAECMGVARG